MAYVNRIYDELETEGRELLASEGIADDNQEIRRFAEIRYIGQAHEVNLPVPPDEITTDILNEVKEKFHQAHYQLYSHSSPEAPTMFVTLAIKAIGRTPKPAFSTIEKGSGTAAAKGKRPVYFGEFRNYVETPVYDRNELLATQVIAGPAIIEQMDSVSVVLPGHEATVDDLGSLIIKKNK